MYIHELAIEPLCSKLGIVFHAAELQPAAFADKKSFAGVLNFKTKVSLTRLLYVHSIEWGELTAATLL